MTDKSKYIFYNIVLSICGIALIVHLLSVLNVYVGKYFPFIWFLHLVVFVIFFLAIIFSLMDSDRFNLNRSESRKEKAKRDRQEFIKLFKSAPIWLSTSVVVIFIYSIANIFLFSSPQLGGPSIIEGKYVLQNHGTIIKEITQEDYWFYKNNELRAFSGHWLLFLGVSALFIHPYSNKIK